MYLFLSLCLLLAAANDIKQHKIPNQLVLMIICSGLIWNTFIDQRIGFITSILGLLAGMVMMLPSYVLGGMGGGDVKLVAAIGSVLGLHNVIEVVLYSYIAMFVMAMVFIVLRGDLMKLIVRYKMMLFSGLGGVISYQEPNNLEASAQKIPLAPAIALGALYVMFPDNCGISQFISLCRS